jgi:hypothetical protein
LSACTCCGLRDSIRRSLRCGNGNSSVNSWCWSDSSAQADTGSTPPTTSALTKPHAHAYAYSYVHADSYIHADIYADGNSNADSVSYSYSHNPANGYTGTTSSSAGDVYWR